jgi:hypothetical protein
MKLHPQNPTPGENKIEQQKIKPTTEEKLGAVVEIIDLLIDALGRTRNSYYYQSARARLEKLKKDL